MINDLNRALLSEANHSQTIENAMKSELKAHIFSATNTEGT